MLTEHIALSLHELDKVSLITGLEYGLEYGPEWWNGQWNGLSNCCVQQTELFSKVF